ncbi:MAG: DUF2254 family protein, partial [Pseudomonadota bacterium]
TFIGAYVYALTAIALREMGQISNDAATVSFFVTFLVLMAVVLSLIRWIFHLQTLGSLLNIARQIEVATKDEVAARMEAPCMGGHKLEDKAQIPVGALPVTAQISGYITRIWAGDLNNLASDLGTRIYVPLSVGSFVTAGTPLAFVAMDRKPQKVVDGWEDRLRKQIPLKDVRSFAQDPRFGMLVMAEIAQKALSPGINDPGSAVDVIHRQARLLMGFEKEVPKDKPPFPRVYLPEIPCEEMLEDAFEAIARDGRDTVEVQIELQKALAQLAHHPSANMCTAAKAMAQRFEQQALDVLTYTYDKDRLRRVCKGQEQHGDI